MNIPIRSFRDLEIYQQGLSLVTRTYQVVDRLPKSERYGLISQMRRAAVSIVANIAEGYGKKRSIKDFRAYLDTAVGSCNEIIALLDVCQKLGYLDTEDWEKLCEAYTVLAKRISVLARNWR